MNPLIFVYSVLIVVFMGGLLLHSKYRSRVRSRLLGELARELGLTNVEHDALTLAGTSGALHLTSSWLSGTRYSRALFSITIPVASSALVMQLMPRPGYRAEEIDPTAASEAAIDDVAFHAAWTVEGAPLDVMHRVLAYPEVRRGLMALRRKVGGSVDLNFGKLVVAHREDEIVGGRAIPDRYRLALALAKAVVDESGLAVEASPEVRAVRGAQVARLNVARVEKSLGDLRKTVIFINIVFPAVLGFGADPAEDAVAIRALGALLVASTAFLLHAIGKLAKSIPGERLGTGTLAVAGLGAVAVAAFILRPFLE